MSTPRAWAALLALVALSALAPAVALGSGARQLATTSLAPGVQHQVWAPAGTSARVHVARVAAGSPARVRVVPAAGGLAAGRETPRSACARTRGCRLAVNGDYYVDDGPVGAVVVAGRMLRSPRPDHEQVSLEPLRMTARGFGDDGWSGSVRSPGGAPVPVDAVNAAPTGEQVVLWTPDLGPATPACTCTELVLRETSERVGTLGRATTLVVTGRGSGGTSLAPGTAVLATTGDRLAPLTAARTLSLLLTVAEPTRQALGAHPLLLKDGERAPLHPADRMLAEPHPRTVVARDASGATLLLAFEGRRPGGPGPTAEEVVRFLLERDVVDAAMLDGGGSTTMVTRDRALSASSDGTDRPVAGSLVVVWDPPPTVVPRTAAAPRSVAARAARAPASPAPSAPTPTATRRARQPEPARPRPQPERTVPARPAPVPVPTRPSVAATVAPATVPAPAVPSPARPTPVALSVPAPADPGPAPAVRAAALLCAAAAVTWTGTAWLLVGRGRARRVSPGTAPRARA